MRRLTFVVTAIGLIAAIITLIGSDYDGVRKNFSYLYDALSNILGDFFVPVLISIIILSCIVLIRFLPLALREWIVQGSIGDVRIFTNRDALDYQNTFVQYARKAHTIDVIGIGNSQFSEKSWLTTLDTYVRLNRTRVRVLFLDPDGEFIAMRERDEGHDPQWLSNQVKAHIRFFDDTCDEIYKKFPQVKGLIERRFYNEYPSANLILINSNIAFVQPYFFSLRGRANPIYLLKETNASVVSGLTQEFERLWNQSSQLHA